MLLKTVYNILMKGVAALLPLAGRLGGKVRLLAEGQKSLPETVQALAGWRSAQKKVIWFHCASLGEFEQGRPVLEAFREKNPDFGILLTFFSPSGYEVRKNYSLADFICYLPLDTPQGARSFVQAARPDIAVWVKYEFWPNMIREIKQSGARLIGISIIFRQNQAFFRPWGGFFRKILHRFDFLFVQNEASARLLEGIGYKKWEVAGDTRFDRVLATANDAAEVPGIQDFLGQDKPRVLVAGSVWPEDMDVLRPFIAAHPEMKFIVAPHDIKPEQIEGWLGETGGWRYSEIADFPGGNVLYIDSIGLLSRLYRYATYALVGGGYRTGLHNILEPAVFGVPIFFGPRKYQKFQEAVDLLELGVAHSVEADLEPVLSDLDLDAVREKAKAYVARNTGATVKILRYLAGE